jgi:hypothetical protein
MGYNSSACPMTRGQVIDEYFIENRTKLLDVAAFLDRVDRTENETDEDDFRIEAFRNALQVLCSRAPGRTQEIQLIFSDPTTAPMERLDQKSARGAYKRQS